MFKFSTTHLVNKAEDIVGLVFNPTAETNKAVIYKMNDAGSAVVTVNTAAGAGMSAGQWAKFQTIPAAQTSLNVGKVNKFFKNLVTSVKVNAPITGSSHTISVSFAGLSAKNYRLFVYIQSLPNADPLYANDTTVNRKPFYVEFVGDATAATAAANFVTSAYKSETFTLGTNQVNIIDNTDGTITLATTEDNLSFYKVELQELLDSTSDTDHLVSYFYSDQVFATIKKWSIADTANNTASFVTETQIWLPGFGTYDYLIRNFKLPTQANAGFFNDNRDELPEVGATYYQYIITVCSERPEVQGMNAVGQYNVSKTTHIIWVKDTLNTAFLSILNSTISPTTAVTVDAAGGTPTTTNGVVSYIPTVHSDDSTVENA